MNSRCSAAGLLQQANVFGVGVAFIGSGEPVRGIHHLARLQQLQHFGFAGLGQLGEDRQEGRFHQQTLGLLAVGAAGDHSARRGRRVAIHARPFQRLAIQDAPVQRYVRNHHLMVGERGVKITPRQLATRHHRVVITPGENPAAVGNLRLVLVRLERRDDRGNRVARTDRRGRNIDLLRQCRRIDEVAVGIDEARQHGLAAEILDDGVGTLLLHRLGVGAGKHDLAAANNNRFDVGWLVALHGEDGAAVNDKVGTRSGRLGLVATNQGECDGKDCGEASAHRLLVLGSQF